MIWDETPVKGECTDGYHISGFEKLGESSNYKNYAIRWLLLGATGAMCNWLINHQWMVQYKSQRTSSAAYKEPLISDNNNKNKNWSLGPGLNTRVAELQAEFSIP